MERRIKFIHTADLHLGSILHTSRQADSNLINIMNNAVYDVFKSICDKAIEEKVDFILISGDIYDKEARSVKANSLFASECKRLGENGIAVFAIGGNHDPINEHSELFSLPENVHIFSADKPEIYEYRNKQGILCCRIIGQSYKENWESRRMYDKYNLTKDDVLNIALLHTQLDSRNNNYVPCTLSDLKEKESINYWALGHIHKFNIINANYPAVIYPGIPQGRDIGEEGQGGIVIVQASDNRIDNTEFVPMSEVNWQKLSIDVTRNGEEEIKNVSELESTLDEKCQVLIENLQKSSEHIKGTVIRININGRSEIYKMLHGREEEVEEYIIENINSRFASNKPFLYLDSVEINIGKPVGDIEALKLNNEVIKSISEAALKTLEQEDILKKLGAIWERDYDMEDINIRKLQLEDELLKDIIRQAELLAIDAVLDRGDEI